MLPADSAVGKEFIPLGHSDNSSYSYCFIHIGKKELILATTTTTWREVFMWCTLSTLLSALCVLILSILTPIV